MRRNERTLCRRWSRRGLLLERADGGWCCGNRQLRCRIRGRQHPWRRRCDGNGNCRHCGSDGRDHRWGDLADLRHGAGLDRGGWQRNRCCHSAIQRIFRNHQPRGDPDLCHCEQTEHSPGDDGGAFTIWRQNGGVRCHGVAGKKAYGTVRPSQCQCSRVLRSKCRKVTPCRCSFMLWKRRRIISGVIFR